MRDRVSLLLYLQKHVPAKKLPVETKMNLPSREECEGWDPAQVAFFLGQVSTGRKWRINIRKPMDANGPIFS